MITEEDREGNMIDSKIGRKISMNRGSLFLFLALVVGFAFASYNVTAFWIRIRNQDPGFGRASVSVSVLNGLGRVGPKFHVAVTASSTPYSRWQSRIMYYWYKRVKDQPGSDMGGFTRVLHSGRPDNLMEEIPTFVVNPLPHGLDQGYVVLNRPWAFLQWLERATIEEEYVLMGEPDHIFVKPLPNLARGSFPAAYPFFYITPAKHEKILRKFYPHEKGPISNVDPIGNSPVIILKSQLKEIAPTWVNVSLRIKIDPEADHVFGWVQEMYAYAVASALHGVKHLLYTEFMVQPPWDLEVGNSYIIHYTYGCDYNKKGELTYGKIGEWRFNKRLYLDRPPPKNLTLPPRGVPETVVRMVNMVNEATANIPRWEDL